MNTIPEVPNTNNEPLFTVAQAVAQLQRDRGLPRLEIGVLMKLGKDCSLAARAMRRPTGMIAVTGQRWTSEKTYTTDVIREAFRLHPATRAYLPPLPEVQS